MATRKFKQPKNARKVKSKGSVVSGVRGSRMSATRSPAGRAISTFGRSQNLTQGQGRTRVAGQRSRSRTGAATRTGIAGRTGAGTRTRAVRGRAIQGRRMSRAA